MSSFFSEGVYLSNYIQNMEVIMKNDYSWFIIKQEVNSRKLNNEMFSEE